MQKLSPKPLWIIVKRSLHAIWRNPAAKNFLHFEGERESKTVLISSADKLSSKRNAPWSQSEGDLSHWVPGNIENSGVCKVKSRC